jgi:hypothetical protein
LSDIGADSVGRQRTLFLLLFIGLPLLLVGRLIFICYWPAGQGLDAQGYQIGRDFINVWAGPRIAFSASPGVLLDLEAYHTEIGRLFGQPLPFHNWSYPLNALIWCWPFAQLPYFAALAVWTTIGLFAFLAVALHAVEPSRRGIAVLLLLAAPASLINIIGGQNGFFSAALLIGGLLCLQTRPVLAGVLFGILAAKPQMLLALPLALLALAAWRTLAAAAVTMLASVLLTTVLIGTEPWVTFLTETKRFQLYSLQLTPFADYYTRMMASVVGVARAAGMSYGPAMVLQLLIAAVVLPLAAWAAARTTDTHLRVFVLVAATPLVTPYVMSYDLTCMAVLLAWYLTGTLTVPRRFGVLVLLAWVTPVTGLWTQELGIPFAPLVHAAVFMVAVRTVMLAAGSDPTWSGWVERSKREWQAVGDVGNAAVGHLQRLTARRLMGA